MLNKQQREFRKLMKEAEKAKDARSDIYSYKEQRFTNEKPGRRYKRPLLQIGGFAGLLLLVWNLYALSTHVWPSEESRAFFFDDQLKVHHYIQERSEAELEISNSINSLIERYNDNSLTSFHIEDTQGKLFELQKKINPAGEQFAAMDSYYKEQFSLAYQITNVLKLDSSQATYDELTYIIQKQDELQASKASMLVQLLENESMSYERMEDGSVSYEYEF